MVKFEEVKCPETEPALILYALNLRFIWVAIRHVHVYHYELMDYLDFGSAAGLQRVEDVSPKWGSPHRQADLQQSPVVPAPLPPAQ